MKLPRFGFRERAFHIWELLIVLAVVVFLAATLLPALSKAGNTRWVKCLSNLRQVDFGFHLFANDHQQKFPMQVSTNDGGSLEYSAPEYLYRHFAAASEQLSTPRILVCPLDPLKQPARDFSSLNNGNLSYFAALNARYGDSNSFLSGDRTLTITKVSAPGLIVLATNSSAKWTESFHWRSKQFFPAKEFTGNVAFGDGSVGRLGQVELRKKVQNSTPATNRILVP